MSPKPSKRVPTLAEQWAPETAIHPQVAPAWSVLQNLLDQWSGDFFLDDESEQFFRAELEELRSELLKLSAILRDGAA